MLPVKEKKTIKPLAKFQKSVVCLHKNTVIIVCGPTAVGKTSFAIELAKNLQTDIISSDSRQCYKELTIGVAKPLPAELSAVHHYFINSHSITDEVNAAVFEQYALKAAASIFLSRNVAVMVGGTGLYIKAFCEGLDNIPAIDPAIRKKIAGEYAAHGLGYLQQELSEKDPDFWAFAEQQNPQRLMRSLEVLLSTGQSITTFRSGTSIKRPFNIIKIGLELPREQLYQQINERVDLMIKEGLVDEVKALQPYSHLNALQTVGYSEIFDFMDGKIKLVEAIANIKTSSRRYAKRQMTWFKKDAGIQWFHPNSSVEDVIKEFNLINIM